ncbi:acyltransferase [Bacillus mobilis]|uniref:acyltransferase n=1 Tax=Bacillus mobilis TaxID=2026190 RepID=UPI000A302673|nr:acyltransferase [Bacillus mobilis]MCU5594421.1 acetyltransferase [Bacillus mobilis]MCU5739493.1 acetyltransferase [Bacillus mobilis]MCU9558178.1 acetyltransferase [Bacillus mobilis]SMD73173.1 dTDP-3-amino-3,6-dideoxy-alpha-D-galactopyranose 3-N-acetyltransferase [Bacillus mobilis]HDR7514047.1 N-acetyltransferase [Bacillus mobilis]
MNKPAVIGQNVVIGDNVVIGEEVTIGNNVVIYEGTEIGDYTIIQDNVVIGKQPTRAKNSILPDVKKLAPTIIGQACTIGTSAIIYANATLANEVFVADLATIRERVVIGERTIIGRGAAVENDCLIGKKCKVETNAYITAYSELGDYVFIAPCVVTTNDNYLARSKERLDKFKGITVKNGGRIGANTTILPGKIIEEDGTVGAGSIVTKDVKKRELVVGTPAKKLRDVPIAQLLENQ